MNCLHRYIIAITNNFISATGFNILCSCSTKVLKLMSIGRPCHSFFIRWGTNFLLWQWDISQIVCVSMCGRGVQNWLFSVFNGEWWRGGPLGLCLGSGDGELPCILWEGMSSSGFLVMLLPSCFLLPRPFWPLPLPMLLSRPRKHWLTVIPL